VPFAGVAYWFPLGRSIKPGQRCCDKLLLVPVRVEMQNTGNPELQRDVTARIEHVLSNRPGDWCVSILSSQANDRWEMKVLGPNAFERSYTLEGNAGEHESHVIAAIVSRTVPV
jgi:hypothetical protein